MHSPIHINWYERKSFLKPCIFLSIPEMRKIIQASII